MKKKADIVIFGDKIQEPCACVMTDKKAYSLWISIKQRCYVPRDDCKNHAYLDCKICNEWIDYNNFKEWVKSQFYIQGYQIDKDILCKGNKEYAPDKCCFVPMFINSLFTKSDKSRGKYPLGVSITKSGTFIATMRKTINGERHKIYLGSYKTPAEAFSAYKKEREKYIQEVADKYRKFLDPRVYQAMYNYKIDIND